MAIDTTRTFTPITIALLTVSDTRGPEEDTSATFSPSGSPRRGTHSAHARSCATMPS